VIVYQSRNNVGSETNTQDLHRNRSAGSKVSMIQPPSPARDRLVRDLDQHPARCSSSAINQKKIGHVVGPTCLTPYPIPSLLLPWREGIPNFACARSLSSSLGPWIRPSSVRDAFGETFSSRFRAAAPIYLSNRPAFDGSDLFTRITRVESDRS
jgi:hypothetical protein